MAQTMRVTSKAGELRRLFSAARHVPAAALVARARREARTRRLLSNPELLTREPLTAPERGRMVQALRGTELRCAALRIAALAASSFAFDSDKQVLRFLASGDRVALSEIDEIAWTNPGCIPASDVNRCFFLAFAEQATLAGTDAEAALVSLCHYLRRLLAAAPLGGATLPIPWQPLPAARRLVNLLAALALLLEMQPSLADAEELWFVLDHLRQLEWLVAYLREDDLGYNHLATQMFAQSLYSLAFHNAEQREKRVAELISVVQAQIGRDGFQLERSATYQAHMLGNLDVLLTADRLPPLQRARIASLATRMRDALATMTHADGGIALFNDAAIGDGPSPACLGAWPRDWKNGVTMLRDAGYVRLQGGCYETFFDAGACGPDENPGHGHADFLSFELSVNGSRLVVDPGVASYKASAERDRTRSAAVHNGPTFAGIEPMEFLGAFRIGRRGRAHLFAPGTVSDGGAPLSIAGWQDGFQHVAGVVARWLGLWPDRLLAVVDVWSGRPELSAVSSFLVPTAWEVLQSSSDRVQLAHAESGVIVLQSLSGTLESASSVHYFPYGPRIAAPALQITLRPDIAQHGRAAGLAIAAGTACRSIRVEMKEIADSLLSALAQRHDCANARSNTRKGGCTL